ncbi:MAG: 1-deoxy-D-xylulose-5-phosphate reductoisomerase [Candidatus Omnitrophota bacterium]|nr:1-deoxy-D-xylulose-5-phosphate reductoisomerase [Candidatus Omnitrophota bacterium]
MRRISIVGSTGSIGINSLRVVSQFPREFSVAGLTAYRNIDLLEQQIKDYSPHTVAVKDDCVGSLKSRTNGNVVILGQEGISRVAALRDADIVVIATSGSSALKPLLTAIRAGKTIALANKEALVMAGALVMAEARKYGARIIPVDSEQSAIFQCLMDRDKKEIKKIYLTASGGPFVSVSRNRLAKVSVKEVLNHPRWKMGRKITVDSATMMNKGLEVIEAMWLFKVAAGDIEVLIHQQAIIHSMVEFIDGSIIAQMGITDMRLPIQYALTYPERKKSKLPSLDFVKLKQLTFAKPDFNKFPCLKLAYEAAYKGGSLPCVMNAANEEAVGAFLNKDLKFMDIHSIIKKVMHKHKPINKPNLEQILHLDGWARQEARSLISS